ncbi:hypothetical protein Salat_1190400 [Sesamum alatum]|uniref:Uncharacterized protein n=1 Tax=Sesamum alatum TaxID=300844 RepID=A0AAE1YEQ3_9LAMI|nr:hypothetical protein Salat_1190400 [Sesamum alatum]
MAPQFNPKAGVSNMCKVVNKGDVESLFGHYMKGLGHLLLSQTAMTPAIIVAMIERYDKMMANLEAALSQLKRARTQADNLKKQLGDEDSKFQEEMSVLKAQVEEKDRKLAMQVIEMESLRTTSIESYTRDREEGLVVGQSAVVATFKASPEFVEEVFR